jgi:hypothetical protein
MSEFFGDKVVDPTGYHGFPPYEANAYESPYIVEVCLKTPEDMKKFGELIGDDSIADIGLRSAKSIWYPPLENGERGSNAKFCWIEED